MAKSRWSGFLKFVSVAAFCLFLVLQVFSTRTALKRESVQMEAQIVSEEDNDLTMTSGAFWRGLLFNHQTLLASLSWLRCLVYYADQKASAGNFSALREYVGLITSVDPYFYPIYEWYIQVFGDLYYPMDKKKLERLQKIVNPAISRFPNNWTLPYTLGAKHVFYTRNGGSTREKLWRVKEATGYFSQAYRRPGSPSFIGASVDFFYSYRRRLVSTLGEQKEKSLKEPNESNKYDEMFFFQQLYLFSTDPKLRENVKKELKKAGVFKKLVLDWTRHQKKKWYFQYRQSLLDFLPVILWDLIDLPDKK